MKNLNVFLKDVYRFYHKREFVHPDPLEFLYDYKNIRDREIVALIASGLAYGRVAQILKSVSQVLCKLGPSPCDFLMLSGDRDITKTFTDFKHRFTTGRELSDMLINTKATIKKHGSLNECFLIALEKKSGSVLSALPQFVENLTGGSRWSSSLLPQPSRGSACKRLNLFLRWMVRNDVIDPGGWDGVDPSLLIIPLDTHMYKIGRKLKFTKRKAADLCTALEITKGFANIAPEDPVKYDFSLTRIGIRNGLDDKFHKTLANRFAIS